MEKFVYFSKKKIIILNNNNNDNDDENLIEKTIGYLPDRNGNIGAQSQRLS
jgi:hypothetical protein